MSRPVGSFLTSGVVVAASLTCLLPSVVLAQESPGNVEGLIASIREHYGTIQSDFESYRRESMTYLQMPDGGEVVRWFDGDELAKMVVTFDGDGFGSRCEYFFWDGELFFVYTADETFQNWPDQDPKDFGKTENRYYFRLGSLLRWIQSSFRNEGRAETMQSGHENFSHWQEHHLSEANLWCAFAESGEEDMDAFREAFDGNANACGRLQ